MTLAQFDQIERLFCPNAGSLFRLVGLQKVLKHRTSVNTVHLVKFSHEISHI